MGKSVGCTGWTLNAWNSERREGSNFSRLYSDSAWAVSMHKSTHLQNNNKNVILLNVRAKDEVWWQKPEGLSAFQTSLFYTAGSGQPGDSEVLIFKKMIVRMTQ